MEFILYCIDKPQRADLRRKVRVPHLEYLAGRQQVFRYGGPLVDDAGVVRGSLMIVSVADRAALDLHMRADPFFAADLFETITVWASRQVVPEREPGALQVELAEQRRLAQTPAA